MKTQSKNQSVNTRLSIDTLKWDTRQRLAMLEATALWEGRITSGILMQLFGISRGQASKDFSLYHQLAGENLIYDLNQKAYFPTDAFRPLFMRGTAEEYLRLVEAGSVLGQSVILPITPTGIGIELIRPPQRKLDFQVLRLVHQAIREQRQLAITYQSMNRQSRELTVEPHTLVYNGFRWHIRAYSQEHTDFRDFVLARIIDTPELGSAASRSAGQDGDWNAIETLTIAPNPGLTLEQQAVIADDYGMESGALQLQIRRALKFYHLRLLNLDEIQDSPQIRQLVLVASAVEKAM